MSVIELLFIAVGLSMDAFAVSVCKGLSVEKVKVKHYFIVGAWFGGFQALMPTIGYFIGSAFEKYITAVDHWIAFGLLVFLGAKMIIEAFKKGDEEVGDSFGFKAMLVLALATSVDALAVGVTFALLPNVNIVFAVLTIGVTTFALSAAGLKIGNVFGARFKNKAEIVGGVILVLMGVKILLSHLGVLPF